MRLTMQFFLLTLAAALALTGCGSSSPGSTSSSQASAPASSISPASTASSSSEGTSAAVKTASNATLGTTVLVDARGMTLYRLSGEQGGKFICTSASCLQVWHPVAASAGGAPSGGVGSLGTVKRPDGTEQVTYKGMPLYTFAKDLQPGEARGQGQKDVGTWSAVTTSASSASAARTSQPAQPAPAAPSSSGGGYGY